MNKTLGILIVLINLALAGYLFLGKSNSENLNIAFVRSQDLVYQYKGMIEAQSKFDLQKQQWQSNIDTLKLDYQRSLNNFQASFETLTEDDKANKQVLLEQQYNNVFQYVEGINQKMKQEEETILQGVLNQVNAYAQEYAKENGYDLILGTTMSGSILYGTDAIDITKPLLEKLNLHYNGVE